MARKKAVKKAESPSNILDEVFEIVENHKEGCTRSRVAAYKSYKYSADEVNAAVDALIGDKKIEEWTTYEATIDLGPGGKYPVAVQPEEVGKILKVVKH